MSEKNASQTQQKKAAAGFVPEQFMAFDAWKKIADENVARMTQFWDELAKFERSSFEQANRAIDESAKLAHESVQYFGQITAEWRKATMDAARRSIDLVNTQA